tara:strand:- start:194 stop:538 length:345 start_codon:yes stop_codon:yes gene_type:complete
MNKVGKKVIFDNINMEIDFTLDDMFEHFNIDAFKFQNGKLLNSDKSLNLEEVEKLVKPYIDVKVKEKFGEDYEIFDYYDTLNLSWNVEIDAVSKITDYRKKVEKELKLPKLKKV